MYAKRSEVDLSKAVSSIIRDPQWVQDGLAMRCVKRGNGAVI
jgi:hypothetical protein